MAGTLEIPVIGSANSIADPRVKASLEALNNKLDGSNNIPAGSIGSEAVETAKIKNEAVTNAKLANEAKPFDWYTPKSIATEESRENAAFGTLTTKDEITGVVLPENGLIVVGFKGKFKSSVSNAGRAAIFIGANQLKVNAIASEVSTSTTEERRLLTTSEGGLVAATNSAFSTTGETTASASAGSGLNYIYAAAGTYAISVQFKASSGTITAKERTLWVAVMGV